MSLFILIPLMIGFYITLATMTMFGIKELIGAPEKFDDIGDNEVAVIIFGGIFWPISWFIILGILIGQYLIKKHKEGKNVNKNSDN